MSLFKSLFGAKKPDKDKSGDHPSVATHAPELAPPSKRQNNAAAPRDTKASTHKNTSFASLVPRAIALSSGGDVEKIRDHSAMKIQRFYRSKLAKRQAEAEQSWKVLKFTVALFYLTYFVIDICGIGYYRRSRNASVSDIHADPVGDIP